MGQIITATKETCVETGLQQADGTYLFHITGGELKFNINDGEEIKSFNIEYSETQSVIDIHVGLIDLDFTTMTSLPTEFIQANEGWFLDGANGLRNKTEQAHSSGCAITFKDLGSGTVEVVFTQSSETSYDYTYVTNSSGTALGNTKGLTTTATTKTFTITDGIIKFNYKKDSSVSTGSDCTWIRSIKVIPT